MTPRFILHSALMAVALTSACGGAARTKAPKSAEETTAPITVQAGEVRATSEGGGIEIPGTLESTRRAVLTSRGSPFGLHCDGYASSPRPLLTRRFGWHRHLAFSSIGLRHRSIWRPSLEGCKILLTMLLDWCI